MGALPIRGERGFCPGNAPRRQQTGLHTDLSGRQIMQRIIANHEAMARVNLQVIQNFNKKKRIGLTKMGVFISSDMVERVFTEFPPTQ